LQPLEDGEKVAKGFLGSFGSTVSGGLPKLGPLSSGMSSALVGGAVAAAPAIGATINAAVLGAVGGGVLAGGILVAAKDSRVQAAWSDFAKTGSDALKGQANVLVDPLVDAAGTLKHSLVDDVIPTFGAGLDRLSPSIDRIATGLAGFAHNIGPGLLDGLSGSQKVLSGLGDDLPRLGSGFGYALREMSKGAEGAKDALGDVVTVIDGVTRATGFAVGKLSQLYALSHDLPLGGIVQIATDLSQQGQLHKSFQYLNTDAGVSAQALEGLSDSAAKAGLGARLSAQDYGILNNALSQTKLTTDQFAGSLVDQALGATIGLDQATLSFAQSQTQLGDVLVHNHSLQDVSTLKGQQLRQAVLAVVAANKEEYDTTLAVTGSATDAAAAWDAGTAALEKQLHNAGLTSAEIDKLIGKYRGVPDKVDTEIATKGLTEAINDLIDLIRQLNGLPTRKVIHVDTIYSTTGSLGTGRLGSIRPVAHGDIIGAARGMVATSAPTVVFGERTLPEAYIPAPNSGISPARATGLLGEAASWWGMNVVPDLGRSSYGGRAITPRTGGGGVTLNLTVNAGWGANGHEIAAQVEQVVMKQLRVNPAFAAQVSAALS
jgi:hypothetical protein